MFEPIDSTTRVTAASRTAAPRPPRHHRHVGERQRNRRVGLVHDDLDGVQALVGHHPVGDLGGDRLDQVARRAGDDVGRPLGQRPVVERVGEVVARRGRRRGRSTP